MTRKLFAELEKRLRVIPICWNRLGKFYHHLGNRESDYLRTPFKNYGRAVALPELRGEKLPGELRRMLGRKRIDFSKETASGDVLLVPEHFGDSRRLELPKIIHKTNLRSVAIFHDAAMERLGMHGKGSTKKFREYLEALAAFNQVVCISEQSRDDLVMFWKELKVPRPPQTVVESWPQEFDESERKAESISSVAAVSSSRRSNGKAEDRRPILLYVSTFQPRKNHLGLLTAAERLWSDGLEFELKLVGAWAGNLSVLKKIRALRAKKRPLFWLKHVDDKTLHGLYRECAFTVYPSLMEGFGLPIVESLWHGRPCVCGGNGALGEVARGGGCLIVDQTKAEALADGIRRLLSDQQLYTRLSQEARERTFRSWSDYIEKFVGHLRAAQR